MQIWFAGLFSSSMTRDAGSEPAVVEDDEDLDEEEELLDNDQDGDGDEDEDEKEAEEEHQSISVAMTTTTTTTTESVEEVVRGERQPITSSVRSSSSSSSSDAALHVRGVRYWQKIISRYFLGFYR